MMGRRGAHALRPGTDMPKAGKKIIIWVIVLTAILLAAVLYYSFDRNSSAGTAFLSDGYYLEVGGDDTVQRVYFAGGDTYRARYPEGYRFADVQGTATDAAADTFLHYNNDAIGSFSDGIVVDLETLGQSGFTPYYRLSAARCCFGRTTAPTRWRAPPARCPSAPRSISCPTRGI